jgi:hypothetical protein
MAKYVVTGGESGESGIHLHGKRYEPGDIVEVANPKKLWLIDAGYLVLASKAKTKTTATSDDDGSD